MNPLPHDLHPAAQVQYRIDCLRSLAACQRADIRSALSGASRRKARMALAQTLSNLRILVRP